MGLSDLFVDVDSLPDDGYGFFQLMFLLATYGYVLFYAANMIGDGSELLLLIPSIAGIVGSCILPVLGAVPDGMIVLFSGMGPGAQESLDVGVGALAGSTIMLITIPWALSVFAGRVDLVDGVADYSKRGRLGLGETTGVNNSDPIKKGGQVMLVTSTTYLLLQGPAFFLGGETVEEVAKAEKPWAFVGLFFSLALFFGYIYYQYMISLSGGDEVTEAKRVEEVVSRIKKGHLNIKAALIPEIEPYKVQGLSYMAVASNPEAIWARLPAQAQARIREIMKHFFRKFDTDKSNDLNPSEIAKVFISMGENVPEDKLKRIFSSFDADGDEKISLDEFILGTTQYIYLTMYPGEDFEQVIAANSSKPKAKSGYQSIGSPTERSSLTDDVAPTLPQGTPPPPASTSAASGSLEMTEQGEFGGAPSDVVEDDDEEEDEEDEEMPEDLLDLPPDEQRSRLMKRSFNMLTLGTLLVVLFSDPMTDVLDEIGTRTGVSSFYVSFVLAPLASNASELLASYNYAAKKTSKSISIALQALQGAACMNNTFCLAIFMALIYFQGLAWQYSAETISILLAQVLIALISFKHAQTMADIGLVLAIYPACIAVVAGLEAIGFD